MPGLHRRKRRPTSDHDYAAMLRRMVTAYGRRVEASSTGVTEVTLLAQIEADLQAVTAAVREQANVAIYLANKRGQSYNELARPFDMTKAAIIKRAKLGELATREREKTVDLEARRAMPRALPALAEPREDDPGAIAG